MSGCRRTPDPYECGSGQRNFAARWQEARAAPSPPAPRKALAQSPRGRVRGQAVVFRDGLRSCPEPKIGPARESSAGRALLPAAPRGGGSGCRSQDAYEKPPLTAKPVIVSLNPPAAARPDFRPRLLLLFGKSSANSRKWRTGGDESGYWSLTVFRPHCPRPQPLSQ